MIDFRPPEELLAHEKDNELSSAKKSELNHYLQIEHLMRLAKARDFS